LNESGIARTKLVGDEEELIEVVCWDCYTTKVNNYPNLMQNVMKEKGVIQ